MKCVTNDTHMHCILDTLRLWQNGRHFTDDIFKCFFLNETIWIMNNISMMFVPKGPINNIPSLAQIMAWCRPGGKPLIEPKMVSLLMHIHITWPQWVNLSHWADFLLDFHVHSPEHIEAATKLPLFCRQHFQNLLERKLVYFDSNFTSVCIVTSFLVCFYWKIPSYR